MEKGALCMNISSEPHQAPPGERSSPSNTVALGNDISRLSHSLVGSISALVMCEHMLAKELAAQPELAEQELLQTTLTLLKESVEQIRDQGDELRRLCDLLKKSARNGNGTAAQGIH
jgi:hypothetical protein